MRPCGRWTTLARGTTKQPKRRDSTRSVSATARCSPAPPPCCSTCSAVLSIADLLPHGRGIAERVLTREPRPLVVILDRAEDLLAEDAHLGRRREAESHLA